MLCFLSRSHRLWLQANIRQFPITASEVMFVRENISSICRLHFREMRNREACFNTTTRFNTYICCFDPFCFSRQFHTTLINHQSDNLWLNDYFYCFFSACRCCCWWCSCCCFSAVFTRKKIIMRSLEGGGFSAPFLSTYENSFHSILIPHAHPLFCFVIFQLSITCLLFSIVSRCLRYLSSDAVMLNVRVEKQDEHRWNKWEFYHKSFSCIFQS